MEILSKNLFPSLVWTAIFDDHEDLDRELYSLAKRMRANDPEGVANTNVKGWQSPNIIQLLPEFGEFNKRILDVARNIGESQNYEKDLEYHHEAWININPPGAHNQNHIHPNCHLSGVYYVRVFPECGGIFFRDPRMMSLMLKPPITQATQFMATEVRMQPEAGRIFVFPAWLEHGVEQNRGNEERISIAFNVRVAKSRAKTSPAGAGPGPRQQTRSASGV
jgi:uncharacterized protein (TIGR02466 family)